MPRKKTIKKTKEEPMFTLSLRLNNEEKNYSGNTIVETLDALKDLEPVMFKTNGLMVLSSGTLRAEHMFKIHELRRLSMNSITREIWAKRLSVALR